MSLLSIIIPVLNDRDELLRTVASIRETGFKDEVIVLDDASKPEQELAKGDYRLVRNASRLGVGKCRHLGAELAQGEWLLFLDSHMRLDPKWYEEFKLLSGLQNTLINGTMLGMNEDHQDVTTPNGEYAGATLLVLDRSKLNVVAEGFGILEGKWISPVENLKEIACCMGAIYFIPKSTFFRVGGLNALRKWGSDEPFLSTKVWMAGGRVVQSRGIRMGHVFRKAAPYNTDMTELVYNKIRIVYEIVDDLRTRVAILGSLAKHPLYNHAWKLVKQDWDLIEEARKSFNSVRTMTFLDFCSKFQLDLKEVYNVP